MIKINLVDKAGPRSSFAEKTAGLGSLFKGGGSSVDGDEAQQINRALFTRLAIVALGPLLLFVIEANNVPPKRAAVGKLRREIEQTRTKNQAAEGAVAEIQRFEKEQERLQSQINAIEDVKKGRLREVKVLDYIQREIPEKVWLSKLELKDGRFLISGYATTDNELTSFMEGLQRSAYLKEVSLVRSSEAPYPGFGSVKRFEISCLMEKQQ